ncbi:MAG TPA: 50S ribosomal protein L22 [bacterium]|nr:50S ribosomal protein L22 [bacterium]
MEAKAAAKYVLISPRKARLAAQIIQGKPVNEALAVLKYTPKKGATMLWKVLNAAIANAVDVEGSGKLDPDTLFVKSASIDPGPMMPRWRPRAFGRASRIRKRMSHIRIVVTTEAPRALEGTRKIRKLQKAHATKKKAKK